jgi:charged multivesicular body protein 4
MFSFIFGKKEKVVDITTNINNIRDSIDVLTKKCNLLEKKIQEESEKTKDYLSKKNKNGALSCLKRKKLYESQIMSFENQKVNLETMIIKLEEAVINKNTLESIQKTNTIFKDLEKQISVTTVEKTMDQMHETMQNFNEIVNVMSNPISNEIIDEDELLSEFMENEKVEKDDNLEKLVFKKEIVQKKDFVEDELNELKRQMEFA